MDLVDAMISRGHEPDIMTYNTIVLGLCKKGKIQMAINILHYMICERHQPDVVTYNTLLDGLRKKVEIEKAMNFLPEMISIGL
jgi:pentatricopeptide repeat protein